MDMVEVIKTPLVSDDGQHRLWYDTIQGQLLLSRPLGIYKAYREATCNDLLNIIRGMVDGAMVKTHLRTPEGYILYLDVLSGKLLIAATYSYISTASIPVRSATREDLMAVINFLVRGPGDEPQAIPPERAAEITEAAEALLGVQTCVLGLDQINRELLTNGHVFAEDLRQTDPAQHMAATKYAVKYLSMIDKMLDRIRRTGDASLNNFLHTMFEARQKLIETNAAYAEAEDIINTIKVNAGIE